MQSLCLRSIIGSVAAQASGLSDYQRVSSKIISSLSKNLNQSQSCHEMMQWRREGESSKPQDSKSDEVWEIINLRFFHEEDVPKGSWSTIKQKWKSYLVQFNVARLEWICWFICFSVFLWIDFRILQNISEGIELFLNLRAPHFMPH